MTIHILYDPAVLFTTVEYTGMSNESLPRYR